MMHLAGLHKKAEATYLKNNPSQKPPISNWEKRKLAAEQKGAGDPVNLHDARMELLKERAEEIIHSKEEKVVSLPKMMMLFMEAVVLAVLLPPPFKMDHYQFQQKQR